LDEFEGHQGQKQHFSALSVACVRFTFGKTSLASSFLLVVYGTDWTFFDSVTD